MLLEIFNEYTLIKRDYVRTKKKRIYLKIWIIEHFNVLCFWK